MATANARAQSQFGQQPDAWQPGSSQKLAHNTAWQSDSIGRVRARAPLSKYLRKIFGVAPQSFAPVKNDCKAAARAALAVLRLEEPEPEPEPETPEAAALKPRLLQEVCRGTSDPTCSLSVQP